jgi:hypothetical protein
MINWNQFENITIAFAFLIWSGIIADIGEPIIGTLGFVFLAWIVSGMILLWIE